MYPVSLGGCELIVGGTLQMNRTKLEIISGTGTLNVLYGGTVNVNDASEGIAFRIGGNVTIAGQVLLSNPSTGVSIARPMNCTIAEGGALSIINPSSTALFNGGNLSVHGDLTISNGPAGIDQLIGAVSNLTVGASGNVTVVNVDGTGINATNVTNDGELSVIGASVGVDLQNTRSFTNRGEVNVTNNDVQVQGGSIVTEDQSEVNVAGVANSQMFTFGGGTSFSPGSSPGCAVFTDAMDFSGMNLLFELEGLIFCQEYDRIQLLAGVTLTGTTLTLAGGFVPSPGSIFRIMDIGGDSGNRTGEFTGLPEGSVIDFNGVPLTLTYVGGDGNDIELSTSAVLPAILSTWRGEVDKDHNRMEWSTLSEVGFSHFTLERRDPGSSNWLSLATIPGQNLGAAAGAGLGN